MALDRPLRIATAAFTQAIVGNHDVDVLVGLAEADVDTLGEARDQLESVALGDEEALRISRLLLDVAIGAARDGTPGSRKGQRLDDAERLAALARSGLLEEDPEVAFERATRLASRVLATPVALVSVVDRDRQFFKSAVGLPEPWASRRETPLSHSFCRYVVESGHPLAVPDAARHPLTHDNAAVEDLQVAAYLGLPIEDEIGNVLGSFCAISHEPRQWTTEDRELLAEIAAPVVRELRLRAVIAELAAQVEEANATMAMLAHDVRAPLSALQQSIETVDRMAASSVPLEGVVEVAQRHVARLVGLAQALLEGQDGERRAATSVDVREMVARLVSDGILGSSASERVLNDVPPATLVSASRAMLEQVVVNLVTNALKHTDGQVRVAAEEVGAETVITISDQGDGVGDDVLRLLRPYERGRSSESGHGIGLSVVAHFVERLCGRLDVDYDSGSICRVAIPAPARA